MFPSEDEVILVIHVVLVVESVGRVGWVPRFGGVTTLRGSSDGFCVLLLGDAEVPRSKRTVGPSVRLETDDASKVKAAHLKIFNSMNRKPQRRMITKIHSPIDTFQPAL